MWVAASATAFLAVAAAGLRAQTSSNQTPGVQPLPPAPSALTRPLTLTGGVVVEPEQPGAIRLTLDDAVKIALANNAQIKNRVQQERIVDGERLTSFNTLMPSLQATGYTRAQEINLAAMGFKPGSINIPGFTGNFPEIVKVNTTSAQLSLSQQLFNAPAIALYRATGKAVETANWATLSARGGLVLQVGGLYLQALADDASVRNAEALVKQDEVVFEHARASKEAGVGINLDVLRAEVQLKNEQQQLVKAQNAVAKDMVQLNRAMGRPAGQQLELVDAIPYSDFDANSSDAAIQAALVIAYEKRKDLRQLEAELEVAEVTERSLKYERLPSVAIGGYYGVLGVTTGSYHGVFAAEGKVNFPIFEEATLRGQKEVAVAQMIALRQQITSRKSQIEADIRASLLDVQSSAELVKVARSNADLAGQALNDATDRFTAGVDDNLPVAQAQATLVGAQARVIQAEFNYNYAKLTLARNTGVVETQYDTYLGR